MSSRVLIVFASRNGSTAEIADAIGRELQSMGWEATVSELNAAKGVGGYNAVVIGGPLYMGRVVTEVGKFVGRHAKELCRIPVAAFTVGTSPLSPNPAQVENAKKALHSAVSPLKPVTEVVFAGKLDPEKLSFFQKKLVALVKSPVGDFRDWDVIARWARELPGLMKL